MGLKGFRPAKSRSLDENPDGWPGTEPRLKGIPNAIVILCFIITLLACLGASSHFATGRPPGMIDYNCTQSALIRASDVDSVPYTEWNTGYVVADFDADDVDELAFLSYDGHIVILDVATHLELLNLTVSRYYTYSLAAGNVDDDSDIELLYAVNDTLYCYDYRSSSFEWNISSYSRYTDLTLIDDNDDGKYDILFLTFLTMTPYPEYTNVSLVRINDQGGQTFLTTLGLVNDDYGPVFSIIVSDVNGDSVEEVIVSDRGMETEWGHTGNHLWVVNASDGKVLHSTTVSDSAFESVPVPFIYGDRGYLAIGLMQYVGANNLLIIDCLSWNESIIRVCNATFMIYWEYISVMEEDVGPIILFADELGNKAAWSFPDSRLVWADVDESYDCRMWQPPEVVDIDDDGRSEVLWLLGIIHVIDPLAGVVISELGSDPSSRSKMVLGDFDGDGYTEICLGTCSLIGYPRTYKISLLDSPHLEVFWQQGGGPRQLVLYPEKEHDFILSIGNVTKELVPSRISMVFWTQPGGNHTIVVLDIRRGTISTEGPSALRFTNFQEEILADVLYLRINCIPDWNVSDEGWNTILLCRNPRGHCLINGTARDAFRIEPHLMLAGKPFIDGREGALSNGSWVARSEWLIIMDFDVVYEGTSDLHPPRTSFTVSTFDGSSWWTSSFKEGDQLSISFAAPGVTGPFLVSLRLFQTPIGEYGKGCFNVSLQVDATNPTVLEAFPTDGIWSRERDVHFGILVDDGESGLDPRAIRYCLVTDPDSTHKEWKLPKGTELIRTTEGYRVDINLTFNEGRTFAVWEAADRKGNRISSVVTINVDRTPIDFKELSPPGWVNDTHVNASVVLEDIGGSGVDGGSIEYSYALGGALDFSEWIPIGPYGSAEKVLASLTFVGQEGKSNLLRFKGRDIAGNMAMSNSTYSIWIDSTSPTMTIDSPVNGSFIHPSNAIVHATILEDGSGLQNVTVRLIDALSEERMQVDTTSTFLGDGMYGIDARWNSSSQILILFQISCCDAVGNIGRETSIELKVNFPPRVSIISPVNGSSFEIGEDVPFSVAIEDQDGSEHSILWNLDGRHDLSKAREFVNNSLPLGVHTISVTIRDDDYTITGNMTFEIVKKANGGGNDRPEPHRAFLTPSSTWQYIAIVALVICASVLLWAGHRYRMGKR